MHLKTGLRALYDRGLSCVVYMVEHFFSAFVEKKKQKRQKKINNIHAITVNSNSFAELRKHILFDFLRRKGAMFLRYCKRPS